MCILEKLNFKISRGSMPPEPPSVLAPAALDPIIAGPTMGNSQYNITYLNQTKTFFFFLQEKSAPSVLYMKTGICQPLSEQLTHLTLTSSGTYYF